MRYLYAIKLVVVTLIADAFLKAFGFTYYYGSKLEDSRNKLLAKLDELEQQ